MKWIILFKGGVETQEFFSVEIAKAFSQKGYNIYWYDLMLQEGSVPLLKEFLLLHRQEELLAFTFNFNGIAGEPGLYDERNGYCLWDIYEIPVYNMVVDHPLYYHKYRRFIPLNYKQISIDKNHIKYMKRFFSDIKLADDGYNNDGFVPLGGTCIHQNPQKRNIDVVFTGNYTPLSVLEESISSMPDEYRELYHSILKRALDEPELLIEDIAEKYIKQELGNISDEELKQCMPNMMYADLGARFYYRGKVIQTLVDNGIKVHLYGAGWDRLECRHPENMILHGNVDSQKCLDVLAQSKISINVMPWFKNGAHDRIFNSMLNKAVCVTDPSVYLQQLFSNNKDIIFYNLRNLDELPIIIRNLLNDEDKLQEMAKLAYLECIENHTWEERANEIINFFNKN